MQHHPRPHHIAPTHGGRPEGQELTGLQRAGQGHFHGQLVIVTENSYRHRLFNGDIGLCLRVRDDDGNERLQVVFDGALRRLRPVMMTASICAIFSRLTISPKRSGKNCFQMAVII